MSLISAGSISLDSTFKRKDIYRKQMNLFGTKRSENTFQQYLFNVPGMHWRDLLYSLQAWPYSGTRRMLLFRL
jgi:hypothetical protein